MTRMEALLGALRAHRNRIITQKKLRGISPCYAVQIARLRTQGYGIHCIPLAGRKGRRAYVYVGKAAYAGN